MHVICGRRLQSEALGFVPDGFGVKISFDMRLQAEGDP